MERVEAEAELVAPSAISRLSPLLAVHLQASRCKAQVLVALVVQALHLLRTVRSEVLPRVHSPHRVSAVVVVVAVVAVATTVALPVLPLAEQAQPAALVAMAS